MKYYPKLNIVNIFQSLLYYTWQVTVVDVAATEVHSASPTNTLGLLPDRYNLAPVIVIWSPPITDVGLQVME